MPALNWDSFRSLPGSAERNFELLCRGIVRQRFGSYGVFRALANQPGVEFHLKLGEHCDGLGDPGRWWGWQCKWYDLPATAALGATRRKDIEDGIRKAETHVAGLTDWALWTRGTLTKKDQLWFNGLSSPMRLHLWTADEVDNLLGGQVAALRSTYFGELILTPDMLREGHDQSIAPIRARWQPNVHHVGEAERDLRRMLGESESWDVLGALESDLRMSAKAVEAAPPVPAPLTSLVSEVIAASTQSADTLDRVAQGIRAGDLDLLRDEIDSRRRALPPIVATAPRRLRSGNHRAGLYATNAVASCRDALRAISDVESAFSSRVVAILAPAGCGKTHLAAQLTAGTPARPHGVLLHGRDFHANQTLDDLARRVSIAAVPVPSMESLLAAVDAAGQRARHRLPVVIDGLNESEDPRVWKPLLASLETALAKYPYVLLACTLRPEFVEDALPEGTRRVEIKDYGAETIEAIREHFRHWNIEATDASLPVGLLKHPLTLRLFCEVTNPTRQKGIGVHAMPGSLTALFDRYLEQVGVRVVELAHRAHRFFAQDVNAAISIIANRLWESRTRSIEVGELRAVLGDAQRPWDQSLVRALEHEGVLLRMPSRGNDSFVPVYDLLGGHIIANALIAKHGQTSFETWIKEPSTTTLLAGAYDTRHPLAADVVSSLVGQLPRRFHSKQLWQLVEEPLRARALRAAGRLESAFLDAATVEALLELVRGGDAELLDRLWEVRGAPGHPLNAEALEQALRPMEVGGRDVRWTEWLRGNFDDVVGDLENLERRWRAGRPRLGDRLRARWVMWTLTSTVRRLRDQATRTLYWFGRVDPGGLFELTNDSLLVNDAYVSERMLAAAYGVVMSHQQADTDFEAHLKPFLNQLSLAVIGPSATSPTNHYLARLYVRGIVAFTAKFRTSVLPEILRGKWSFGSPEPVQPVSKTDPQADEVNQTLGMDFENYTLGRLFDDRDNYDMNHSGHQAAVAHVRGVVWALGWRAATFEALDGKIADATNRHGRGDQASVERYGKKYGWIGFFTYAGLLEDLGQFPLENHQISDVDIDPSFPEHPPIDGTSSIPEAWLSPAVASHESWVLADTTSLPSSVIRREAIGKHPGPWVAVHGHVSAGDRVLGRYAWAFISALLVLKKGGPGLIAALKSGTRPWITRDLPSDHYTFSGEIPWHPNFASVARAEQAYWEPLRISTETVNIEVLAHKYTWESYHSEMNRAGNARVPSHPFSHQFDLRSTPQSFDQFLPDGSRAAITLSGVDGLDGDVLYIREDLLHQYVGDRTIVWFAFGERQLRPYPPTPPKWLVDAQRQRANEWQEVFTEEDLAVRAAKARATTTKVAAKKSGKKAKTKSKLKAASSRLGSNASLRRGNYPRRRRR
jgi:hypothetical protein